jgi:hypothetical protein
LVFPHPLNTQTCWLISLAAQEPGKWSSADKLDQKMSLLQLQLFLESREGKCEVDGVTPSLFDEIKAHMLENGQAGVWENLQ